MHSQHIPYPNTKDTYTEPGKTLLTFTWNHGNLWVVHVDLGKKSRVRGLLA